MARRNDHTREQLKDLILETAWKIAGKEGMSGLSARRIASEIGYVPGTIYNIFASMDDLYLHLNARTLDLLYDILNDPSACDPRKAPTQNMKKMADLYMKFAHDYRPYWLFLFSYIFPKTQKQQPWYQEKINRLFDPLENLLIPLFPKNRTKEKSMAARTLWASVHGILFLEKTGKYHTVQGDKTTAMTDYLIDSLVTGIQNRKK